LGSNNAPDILSLEMNLRFVRGLLMIIPYLAAAFHAFVKKSHVRK
jgi:hypothetical protein